MKIQKITTFPVKSLSWIDVELTTISKQWVLNDRRYMIIERVEEWIFTFLSQRRDPQLWQLETRINWDLICIQWKDTTLSFSPERITKKTVTVKIRDSENLYYLLDSEINNQLSEIIWREVYLVTYGMNTKRTKYWMNIWCQDRSPVSFFLNSTIDHIQSSLEQDRNNFRYNIVLEDSDCLWVYWEDILIWKSRSIWEIKWCMERPISRCKIVNNNPNWGQTNILKELASQGRNTKVLNQYWKEKRWIFAWVWWYFTHDSEWMSISIWNELLVD